MELKIALMHENSQVEQRKGGGSCILGPIFLVPMVAESPCGICNLYVSLLILHTNPVYGFLVKKKKFSTFFFIKAIVLTVLYASKGLHFL